MEHWIEINLAADATVQDQILLDVLGPYVKDLEERGRLVTYHFFREPDIRFRVRIKTAKEKRVQSAALAEIAESLVRKGQVSEWRFGNHGEAGRAYKGEEDRYGRNGWKVAQEYFRNGSDTALELLALRRRSRLENPLWGKGLGNPWEGGGDNPWREREDDPVAYHWSRFVHLFSNQVGFDMEKEARLCEKQAEKYREVVRRFGVRW